MEKDLPELLKEDNKITTGKRIAMRVDCACVKKAMAPFSFSFKKTETRSLDGDMKTLVYENYSKFISATETIKKVRDLLFSDCAFFSLNNFSL